MKTKHSKCVLRNEEGEKLDHLFLKCSLAQAVLFGSDLNLRTEFIYLLFEVVVGLIDVGSKFSKTPNVF